MSGNLQVQENVIPVEKTQIKTVQATRLDFLDNLKVALTCLVVAHHAGQPYGGSGGFWYYQPRGGPELHLGNFFAVNAGFFMSLFFLISAYFLPSSFDKKGAGKFMKDRLERLGVPVLFGFFVIVPLMMYQYYVHYRGYGETSFVQYYWNVYFGLGGKPAGWTGPSWPDLQFAHLWFLEHLLFYAAVYTVARRWFGRSVVVQENKSLSNLSVFLFAMSVAVLTFATRIRFPVDYWEGFIGFIQAEYAHVPQYASFFAVGLLARQRNWFTNLTRSVGLTWLIVGLALAVMYYVGLVTIGPRYGLSMGNLVYAFYETFLCTGLCVGLIYLFRRNANRSSVFTRTLAENAFAVYIVHVPVLVALQYAFERLPISMLAQFVWVMVLGIVCSFVLSHFIVRKLSYLRRIL